MEVDSSLEERLAQAMIDMRKGHLSNSNNLSTVYQRRDYLLKIIDEMKRKIDLLKRENKKLSSLQEKTLTISHQINPIREIDAHLVPDDPGRCHGTRDIFIQTDPVTPELPNIPHKAEKFKLINNLSNRGQMLQDKLKNLQLATNHRGSNYLMIKISEYNDLVSQVREIENLTNSAPTNIQQNYLTSGSASTTTTTTTTSKIGMTTNTNSSNNGIRVHEESDDEGVQLLLSMKRNVFNCKCGEYLNSITDWSEHQRICSKSTEKTIGEQCPLCKKTFLTCVALNIHSTKKHNKKKIRTDSVMHCPCGQSFTAKWRQNCVHKLNSHGRHCKAFKERETQCSICKKGFIDRKSLEYHGLKAHKLAVPVNS